MGLILMYFSRVHSPYLHPSSSLLWDWETQILLSSPAQGVCRGCQIHERLWNVKGKLPTHVHILATPGDIGRLWLDNSQLTWFRKFLFSPGWPALTLFSITQKVFICLKKATPSKLFRLKFDQVWSSLSQSQFYINWVILKLRKCQNLG
jgi:hypothetical protein